MILGDHLDLDNILFICPGKLADAIVDDVWDVANIAVEAERAKTIHFSPAYSQIQVSSLCSNYFHILSTTNSLNLNSYLVIQSHPTLYLTYIYGVLQI